MTAATLLGLLTVLVADPGQPPTPAVRRSPAPTSAPGAPAGAVDRFARLSGARVWIDLGHEVVRGRLWLLDGGQLLVQVAGRKLRVIARAAVRGIGRIVGPEPKHRWTVGPPAGPKPSPTNFHPTWIGLRAYVGGGYFGGAGGLELTLLQLRYQSFFFDVLHLGVGFPTLGYAGFAIGGVVRIDRHFRRAILLGAHFTWAFGPGLFGAEVVSPAPLLSGVLVEYRYAYASGMDLSVGVRSQYIGAVLTVGVGY